MARTKATNTAAKVLPSKKAAVAEAPKPKPKEVAASVESEELKLKAKKKKAGPVEKERRRGVYLRRLMKQVRKMQRGGETLLPKAPLSRLVRECAGNVGKSLDGYRFQGAALDAIQQALEDFIVEYFSHANESSELHLRPTILPLDLKVAASMVNVPHDWKVDMKNALDGVEQSQCLKLMTEGKRLSQLAFCARTNNFVSTIKPKEAAASAMSAEEAEAYQEKIRASFHAVKPRAAPKPRQAAVVSPLVADLEAEEASEEEEPAEASEIEDAPIVMDVAVTV